MSQPKPNRAIAAMPSDPTVIERVLGAPAMQKQLLAALPRSLTPQQIVRQAITLLRTSPSLCECSQFSVLSGIFKAAELGLALSGPLGQAYLVPRYNKQAGGKEATFQVGYKGLFQLAYRSKTVKRFELRTRYANDAFDIRLGTGSFIHHVPNLDEPGEAVGYYTVVTLQDGIQDFEYMSRAQAQKHREQFGPKGFSPWQTNFDEMAMKTTARRLAKRLPMATELAEACAEDERGEVGLVAASNLLGHTDSSSPETSSRMDELADSFAEHTHTPEVVLDDDEAKKRAAEVDGL